MRQGSRRGSNAIEFALTLPIFVIMLGGMLDFSWYFFSAWRVSSAVREGIRVGSLTMLADDPIDRAETALDNAATAYDLTWTVAPPVTIIGNPPNCGIQVQAEASVPPLIGIITVNGKSLAVVPNTVRYEAVMRLEDQTC